MLTILHISDLHFGPHFLPEVGEALLERAAGLEPDLVVASGDFTQRARARQFAEARAFLDRLPAVPTVVTPGNHDVPLYRVGERLFGPYRHYRHYIAEELDTVSRVPGAAVVAINSTAPLRAIVNGRIDPWQLEFCAAGFAGAPPGTVRIVVAHHQFAPAPDWQGGQVVRGCRRALARFCALEVDLVLGGHLHRAYVANSLDVSPDGDRSRGTIIIQSGTSTSGRGRARERGRNSFNLVRVDGDTVQVTPYQYFDRAGGFAPVGRHVLPRPGRQWLALARAGAGGGPKPAATTARGAGPGPGA